MGGQQGELEGFIGLGLRVQINVFWFQGLAFRVWGLGCRVFGLEVRSGFKAQGLDCSAGPRVVCQDYRDSMVGASQN